MSEVSTPHSAQDFQTIRLALHGRLVPAEVFHALLRLEEQLEATRAALLPFAEAAKEKLPVYAVLHARAVLGLDSDD